MNTLGVFAVILLGVNALGGVFLGIWYFRAQMMRDWVSTIGVVTDRHGNVGGGLPHYYPTFMWQDQTGRWHRRTSNVGASLQPSPGKPVPVKYDPANPDRAVMDTFSQSGAVFKVIGLVICGLGSLMTVAVFFMVNAMSSATTP